MNSNGRHRQPTPSVPGGGNARTKWDSTSRRASNGRPQPIGTTEVPISCPTRIGGGASKGEQLQNFVEHSSLLGPPTATDGRPSSPEIPSWSPPAPDSTGSVTDSGTLAYSRWALRAWLRQGRTGMSPSSETASAEEELEDSSDEPLPPTGDDARIEKKRRTLWAYRQRAMAWANPMTWTRPSFRRKLNANFVDALMGWPANWSNVQTACGPEVMELWLSKGHSLLESLWGGQMQRDRSQEIDQEERERAMGHREVPGSPPDLHALVCIALRPQPSGYLEDHPYGATKDLD